MPKIINECVFCPEKNVNRPIRECFSCDRLKMIAPREGGEVRCRPKPEVKEKV